MPYITEFVKWSVEVLMPIIEWMAEVIQDIVDFFAVDIGSGQTMQEQIDAIIAYIEALNGNVPPPPRSGGGGRTLDSRYIIW